MLNIFTNISEQIKVPKKKDVYAVQHSGAFTGAEHGQDYLCSFMPRCTPSDDPDAEFSLQGGADQAAHL